MMQKKTFVRIVNAMVETIKLSDEKDLICSNKEYADETIRGLYALLIIKDDWYKEAEEIIKAAFETKVKELKRVRPWI